MNTDIRELEELRNHVGLLAREVKELRDRESIREVLDNYAFLLDTARWRDIPSEVFTVDAVDHHSPEAGDFAVPRGRAQLTAFFESTMMRYAGTQHFLGNSRIDIDGDRARSRTYGLCAHWEIGHAEPQPSDLTVAVAYDDAWIRTPEGWRICERWVHTFGPHGVAAGRRSADQPRLGSDLYGNRDRC